MHKCLRLKKYFQYVYFTLFHTAIAFLSFLLLPLIQFPLPYCPPDSCMETVWYSAKNSVLEVQWSDFHFQVYHLTSFPILATSFDCQFSHLKMQSYVRWFLGFIPALNSMTFVCFLFYYFRLWETDMIIYFILLSPSRAVTNQTILEKLFSVNVQGSR